MRECTLCLAVLNNTLYESQRLFLSTTQIEAEVTLPDLAWYSCSKFRAPSKRDEFSMLSSYD